MIAPWPPKKPRYKTKRLREAINVTAQTNALADFVASTSASAREASTRLQEMRDAITQAITDIDELRSDPTPETHNRRLTNIRNSLTDVINESPQS